MTRRDEERGRGQTRLQADVGRTLPRPPEAAGPGRRRKKHGDGDDSNDRDADGDDKEKKGKKGPGRRRKRMAFLGKAAPSRATPDSLRGV